MGHDFARSGGRRDCVFRLPLCFGSVEGLQAPLFSGILAGIVGGILVGLLSGSHTSVSGPAAGLTAIVATEIARLGTFEAFLLAGGDYGCIQIVLGICRAGFIAAFFPSSVIKGLLAAIGVTIILKQIPHLVGHDTAPEGEFVFQQLDQQNTFSSLAAMLSDYQIGAMVIGLLSLVILIAWDRIKPLKKSVVPAPLVVVILGVMLGLLFENLGKPWTIPATHLVQVPVAEHVAGFFSFLQAPDFSQWNNPAVYMVGLTIAIVASLETLLNLEAVDKLDPQQRVSPASRELLVQGIGNVTVGLMGGIPMTSVIVRSSVNINAGGRTKLATIVHGLLLLFCVMFLAKYLNMVPLSCLAAILLVTGIKLASPALFKRMWSEGRYQFMPFIATLVAIVLTDLVVGILIGLAIGLGFILYSNYRRPINRIVEKHLGGDVLHIELANQVSFLNRPALETAMRDAPRGSHVLLDASNTHYIDPDVLDLIRDFKETIAPAHDVQVSLQGFRDLYELRDEIQFVDYSTRELQEKVTPDQVLQILRDGNERFRTGKQLTRDFTRQLLATSQGQHPIAVVLSCIDSRTPSEIIFDMGLGDIFSVRVAGNVTSPKVLGSIEYGCAVAGAKLILVVGHTRCGAVTAAVNLASSKESVAEKTGCQNLEPIVRDIQRSIPAESLEAGANATAQNQDAFVDMVARRNVERSVQQILEQSETLSRFVAEGSIKVVGAMYDVATGQIEFMGNHAVSKLTCLRVAGVGAQPVTSPRPPISKF